MRRGRIFGVSLAAVCLLASASALPGECAKKVGATAGAPVAVDREAAIRGKVDELKNGVVAGNAKAVAGLWSDDGRYLDDEGNTYIGRTAIEKIFGALLANNGKPKVEIAIEKMRFPAGNVALVEGIVKRSPAANVPAVPMTRFSMVFEQKGTGPWQIAAATETPMVSQKAASDGSGLGSLNWLIGDWTAKRNGAEVRMKAEWVPTKNFIFMTYHIAKAGEPEKRETQVIGWDARTQTPISWLFDSSGGFGEGKWTRSSGQWLVTAEAVDRQGRDVTAVNVISQNGPDSFTWQSVNRRVNGTLVEDTQPVKVERVGTSTANK